MQTLFRLPDVRVHTAKSRSSIYADIRRGLFVPPVAIGTRAVAWPASEIEAINAAHIAGKSADEIRALVRNLVAARKVAA